MPRIGQPKTLEEISLRKAADTFINMVKNLIDSDGEGSSTPCSITECTERIRQEIYANLPSCLHENFSTIVLEETLYMTDLNAVKHIKRIAIYPEITSFRIDDVLEEQGICKYLNEMTNLKTIHMNSEDGSLYHKLNDVEIGTIVAEVSSLSNITSFTLISHCTNEILTALAECCPKLVKLNVNDSGEVSECNSFLKLPYLEEIGLWKTSVGDNGIAEILLHSDNLKLLYGATGEALELYREKSNQQQLEMKELGSHSITTHNLLTLVTIFPNITSLSISNNAEHYLDLTALIFLKDLRDLSLENVKFYTDNLVTFLDFAESRITDLSLFRIRAIDLYVIEVLGEFCSNLKNLELKGVDFMLEAPSHFVKRNLRPYQRLRYSLIEESKFAPITYAAPIEYVLKNGTNLKCVCLCSRTNIIEQALRRNELSNLMRLGIVDTSSTNSWLSINFARLVMEKCPHICELTDLRSWSGVSTAELRNFKRELQMNNIDISIDEESMI